MSERIDEGTIKGAVDFVKIKGMETILMQMKKSICKIDGKLTGAGFFCRIKYDNKYIPCLLTNFHVLDKGYIKKNSKIGISMNDNKINEDIIINEEDIIYQSIRNEYDLIIIKLKEGKDYMNNINYLEFDDNIFCDSLKGYESLYILHYPNDQNAAVSYGKVLVYDENKYDIQYKYNTLPGAAGGPILNLITNKVIGIHKGCIQKKDGTKYNIGTFLKDPLEEINNNNLYNNYNIKLKNPIHILNYHTMSVDCLTVMNDGRLVSGSRDNSIIIYNKETKNLI